ncbi:MAG TPA: hypothetical protein VJ810_19675 [Blastocatellia bacterium]|nr:hypothetical protein [Blastocatellia bacterium]
MSNKNNINPDHYKTAGRERQGEDIIHEVYKRRYSQSKSRAGGRARNFIPGVEENEYPIEADLKMIAETERRIDKAYRKGG